MATRRKFLINSSIATAGSLLIPKLSLGICANETNANHKVLVVINFAGGNDGLNMVVPFKNEIYLKARPKIAMTEDDVIELNDEVGLHPKLKVVESLFEEGEVTIINGVGYPVPDKTHQRSTEIWQTASHYDEIFTTGWIGRYLDYTCKSCRKPHLAMELDDSLSLTLKGDFVKGLAMSDISKWYDTGNYHYLKEIAHSHDKARENANLHFLYQTMVDSVNSAHYITEKTKAHKSKELYPLTQFSLYLKKISELIVSNSDTKIFYVTISGFDTHANQLEQQERLFKIFSEGLKVFIKDLKANKKFEDVLILTISEFGRRLEENSSEGTEHGTANSIFLIGSKLQKPGLYNNLSDLKNLDEFGDIKHDVDFRSIYATIIKQWLHADDKVILKEEHSYLPLLKL